MFSIKPTQICVHNPIFGPRNIGHYFGSIKDLVEKQNDYETYVIIDDVMAVFMCPRDKEAIENRSLFVVQDFLNAGLDIENNEIILTSQILKEVIELMMLYTSVLDQKYCQHLFENSFLGGLKKHERKGMGLSPYPSVFEYFYPAFGMPSISLGLDAQLFQGGEEIMGYVYIMEKIIENLNENGNLNMSIPVYEKARNGTVLGIDGKYMFQHNSIFLCEDEESLKEKIDSISDKRVLIDWFNSLGYKELANQLKEKKEMDYEKSSLFQILKEELSSFREGSYTNIKLRDILIKSKEKTATLLQYKIEELKELLSIPSF